MDGIRVGVCSDAVDRKSESVNSLTGALLGDCGCSDARCAPFWSDPFGLRSGDFDPESLRREVPRILFAVFAYCVLSYVNCLSQAFVQSWSRLYFEGRWEPNEPFSQPFELWDVGFLYLPRPPFSDVIDWPDFLALIIFVATVLRFFVLPGPRSLRWNILRRTFLLMGVLLLFRAASITSTVLPNLDRQCVVSETRGSRGTIDAKGWFRAAGDIFLRQATTCMDVLFTGHTVTITTCVFVFFQYSGRAPWDLAPRQSSSFVDRFICGLLRTSHAWRSGLVVYALFSYCCIISTRAHYTCDVFLDSVVTVLILFSYHHFANIAAGSKDLWAVPFNWFEMGAKDVQVFQMVLRRRTHSILSDGERDLTPVKILRRDTPPCCDE
eukprot:TRINITY_DN56078_c0_g1_i1.p1 TRINITY_DN56078_c0_g1~~TRINITY_DN56078_c0_g1_i1.p1  ORF type:complete len:381 (+),score=22.88 TRINITY_DN56078_c0_g1_i1:81-1223(+)